MTRSTALSGGGDSDPGDPNNARTATSSDGGKTWALTNPPPVAGAIFGLCYVGQTGEGAGDSLGRAVVITANDPPTFSTGAAAWTPDEGTTWFTLPGVSGFWAVGLCESKSRMAGRYGWSDSEDQLLKRVDSKFLRRKETH